MIHLWNVIADASAAGNALHLPMVTDDALPIRDLLDRAERTAGDVQATLDGRTPRRLGVLMENGETWLRGALAAARLDAAFVPLPLPVGFVGADSYAEHLSRIVTNADLDAVLVDATLSRGMRARVAGALDPVPLIDITEPVGTATPPAPPSRGDDALAVIQYTSGSTSKPKGVALSHRNVVAGLEAVTGGIGWIDGDAFGVWIPLFHDMGLFATLSSLARGSSVCLWRPSDFIRRPLRWLESFATSPATVMPAPNFCFDYLVAAAQRDGVPEGLDLSSWRIACNGAEPVQHRSLVAFQETFGPHGLAETTMTPVYGMAEATLVVTAPRPNTTWHSVRVDRDRLRIGERVVALDAAGPDARAVVACGRAAPAIEIRVAGEDGVAYADGVVGEVQITGPGVTGGYLGLPDAEQPFTADHWLRTGDLAFQLDGDLYVVGRLKDMITVRGQNFYAEDVEEIVRTTPGIDRTRNAAIAWNDGAEERMVVLWETALGTDDARVMATAARDRVKQRLGLEAVEVVPVPLATIPHTTSGKVQRQAAMRLVLDNRVVDGRWRQGTTDLVTESGSR